MPDPYTGHGIPPCTHEDAVKNIAGAFLLHDALPYVAYLTSFKHTSYKPNIHIHFPFAPPTTTSPPHTPRKPHSHLQPLPTPQTHIPPTAVSAPLAPPLPTHYITPTELYPVGRLCHRHLMTISTPPSAKRTWIFARVYGSNVAHPAPSATGRSGRISDGWFLAGSWLGACARPGGGL